MLSFPAQTFASPADTVKKGGGFPLLPVAIGVVVVGVIAALGAVFVTNNSGGDSVPVAAVAPTETPAPTQPPAPTETLAPPAGTKNASTILDPTYTPRPTYTSVPTLTPNPTPYPTNTPWPTPLPTATPYPSPTPYPNNTPFPIPSCSDLEGPTNYSIIVDQVNANFAGKTVSFTVGGNHSPTTKIVTWIYGGSTYNVDLIAFSGRTGLNLDSTRGLPVAANAQRIPPHVFTGKAFLDCGLASVGTSVSAGVDGEIVGTSWVENIEPGSVIPCRTSSNQSSPCEVFDNVIQQDNLVAVWKFSIDVQSWFFYVPDGAFFGVNNLTLVAGDIVWVNVKNEQAFQTRTLFSSWNLISLN